MITLLGVDRELISEQSMPARNNQPSDESDGVEPSWAETLELAPKAGWCLVL
jgi:hypothetical protein